MLNAILSVTVCALPNTCQSIKLSHRLSLNVSVCHTLLVKVSLSMSAYVLLSVILSAIRSIISVWNLIVSLTVSLRVNLSLILFLLCRLKHYFLISLSMSVLVMVLRSCLNVSMTVSVSVSLKISTIVSGKIKFVNLMCKSQCHSHHCHFQCQELVTVSVTIFLVSINHKVNFSLYVTASLSVNIRLAISFSII